MAERDAVVSRFLEAQDRLVIQASDLSLETIAEMVEKGSIDIGPVFQRRERWKREKQSALIESFLLNVPVPPIYLSEDDFGTYSVIDGKQRIMSIHGFMRGELELRGLKEFHSIEGMRFRELPPQMQNALRVRPYLRAVTLLKQSDPELKYEVFTRLNTGGEPLNAQEIRNVAFRGPLNNLIYELADTQFLQQQLKIRGRGSSAFRVMADAEYVLRFFTLHDRWESFSGDLRRSLDDYMKENRTASGQMLEALRGLFRRTLEDCENVWGEAAFKRPVESGWRDQMLAGMYDAQMLSISFLTKAQVEKLVSEARPVIEATRDLFLEDKEFEEAVRRATNTPSRIRYRVRRMIGLLDEFL